MLSQQFNHLLYDYRAVLFIIICLAGQILGWRLWRRWVSDKGGRQAINIVFAVFNLAWFFVIGTIYFGSGFSAQHLYEARNYTDLTLSWVGRPAISWQLAYVLVILPLGVSGSVLCGLVRRIKKKITSNNIAPDESRRDFIKTVGVTGCLTILGTTGYSVIRQGRPPQVSRRAIVVPGLPPALDGFTIAHITDIHLGLWASQKELERALAVVAAEKPHLAAFTGDLVDRRADFARLYFEPLKLLSSLPYGVWGVLGNHDHYTGAPERVADLLRDSGRMVILMDQQANIPDLPLSIIGLDDQGVHHSWMGSRNPGFGDKEDPDTLDFGKVVGPPPHPGDFVILLNHRPEGFKQAMNHGCHLYLAGHTHGGQYQIPYHDQLNLAAAFYKYSSGLYHEHGGWLNVSRGIAAVGLPFRLWAWPEISLIKLVKGA